MVLGNSVRGDGEGGVCVCFGGVVRTVKSGCLVHVLDGNNVWSLCGIGCN